MVYGAQLTQMAQSLRKICTGGFEILILGKVLNPSKCNKYPMISIRRDKTCLSENCIFLMKLLVLIQILTI